MLNCFRYHKTKLQYNQSMQHERMNKIAMYHSPQTTTYRHYHSTDNAHLKVQPQDPLRQQLTSYLSHFRDEPVSSNLLVNNGKALPTLYSKAKKYSLFTVKRKANRSYHSPFSSRPIEILPTLRRLKM